MESYFYGCLFYFLIPILFATLCISALLKLNALEQATKQLFVNKELMKFNAKLNSDNINTEEAIQ